MTARLEIPLGRPGWKPNRRQIWLLSTDQQLCHQIAFARVRQDEVDLIAGTNSIPLMAITDPSLTFAIPPRLMMAGSHFSIVNGLRIPNAIATMKWPPADLFSGTYDPYFFNDLPSQVLTTDLVQRAQAALELIETEDDLLQIMVKSLSRRGDYLAGLRVASALATMLGEARTAKELAARASHLVGRSV